MKIIYNFTDCSETRTKYRNRCTSYKSRLLKLTLRVVLICLSTFSAYSHSTIISVQGSTAQTQLSTIGSAQVQLTWSVVEQENAIGQATISSTEGFFFDSSREILIGRDNRSLIMSQRLAEGANTNFIFRESLVIPRSIMHQANEMGLTEIVYVRAFTDTPGNTTLSNAVRFSLITSGFAGQLKLTYIQMEFDNSKTSTIITAGSPLHAQALLNYKGSGLISYGWEIATPPSTKNQPVFSPLVRRQQYLMSGGQVTIKSPKLPSRNQGSYLLQLRITQPESEFKLPILRYIVSGGRGSESNIGVASIQTILPLANQKLVPETTFSWNPVDGAKAYQLELYDRPIVSNNQIGLNSEKPITGILIPAKETQTKIGRVSRTHLLQGTSYYWQVVAVSAEGKIIGKSELKRVNY